MVDGGKPRLTRLKKAPSLKNRAYQSIKDCILHDMTSHQPLYVEELAGQLGISRTPVREALLALELEGLVYSIPNKGTFVAAPTVEEVVEIYQTRAALEGLAVRLATPVIPDEELGRLRTAFDSAQEPIEEGDLLPYFQSDLDFHSAIRQYSGNEVLKQLIENLEERLHRIRVHARERSREHPIQSYEEHRQVLAALIERDAAKAESLMKMHLNSAAKRIEQILQSELEL
jgi:DNA-binding GntR family transcriptional regulator